MKRLLFGLAAGVALALAAGCSPNPFMPAATSTPSPQPNVTPPYGANASASGTFERDGVKFYYETYGEGEPLLLVHGNGASIGGFAAQIDHFRKSYRVIAMDSRDQGKSSNSAGAINYEIMADDLAALLDHLKVDRADVVGWSDGGIEALLLGLRHPAKVKKLVAMAANLDPGPSALYPETDKWFQDVLASMPAGPESARERKVTSMMLAEPHIDVRKLEKITAPTLVISGDHDLIKLEHTVDIFNHLPNANLAVLPNATHGVPYDDPALFNAIVETFLKTEFRKRDRIADVMTSIEKMSAAMPK
jgi:pimeloyl-ACP methyl ester carboxylesterase